MINIFGKCDNKKEVLLFQSYFFLGNIRAEHSRELYNILDLISEVGGLYAAVYTVIGSIGAYVNI